MGEYAVRISDGERVKIGTCESMYYLRADQRHEVHGGDLSHVGPDAYWRAVRFRFPFPDEDRELPGAFDGGDFQRSVRCAQPMHPDVEHGTIQLVQSYPHAGGNVCMPCPLSSDWPEGVTFHKNGWAGDVKLCQQRLLADGRLVAVFECGGCGAKWREEDRDAVQPAIDGFIAEAEERERHAQFASNRGEISAESGAAEGAWYREMARRLAAGYDVGASVALEEV